MKKWTKEQIDYLKQIHTGKSNEEITKLINQKFNTNYSVCAVGCKKNRIDCKSEYKKQPKIWTEEIIDFMIEHYKGKDNIELAELVNEKFGLNTSGDKISNVKTNLKRRKGIDLTTGINRGCYKKGNTPANKGKTWDKYMSEEGQENSRKTTFKKGNIPDNYRPVGSERISVYGYAEIKVADPNVWELKHRYIYKQHYGKIPDGYNVMFADKNRQNFDIDNLILVSKSEDLIMNRNELFFEDKELTKSGHLIAKVIDKTYKRRKEK